LSFLLGKIIPLHMILNHIRYDFVEISLSMIPGIGLKFLQVESCYLAD
jgi:hypothetical protein